MAKMERYGGNPKCIIAEPEIDIFEITQDTEYILLGSDGIFDYLENE